MTAIAGSDGFLFMSSKSRICRAQRKKFFIKVRKCPPERRDGIDLAPVGKKDDFKGGCL